MKQPIKVYLTDHGILELNKNYYATAFPDKDKVSHHEYVSVKAIKELIKSEDEKMEYAGLVRKDELLELIEQ